VDAIFYDRRDDPDNVLVEVYYAFSTDGGATFSANVKITSRNSAASRGPSYFNSPPGVLEYGSRMGLVSRNNGAVAAWTDNHTLPVRDYQDVFATIVRLEPVR
jgi:hypothetical protein